MPELIDPLSKLREELAHVKSPEEALTVLAFADLSALRAIEREFCMVPSATESILRLRLALVACRRATGKDTMREGTTLVTSSVVRDWAIDTLDAWLPGYTDWDDDLGGQYHITRVKQAGHTRGMVADLFEVSTVDRKDPRQFIVAVGVAAVADADEAVSEQDTVAKAIEEFPWHDFGLDEVSEADKEWIGELAKAIVGRLDAARDSAGL